MAATYVEIDIGGEDATFFCPACGVELISEDGVLGSTECPHFLFGYIDQVGDWDSVSDAFAPVLKKIVDESPDEGDLVVPWDEDFLSRCPDGTMIFALCSRGMACGPVSLTVLIGVSFFALEEAEAKPEALG